MLYKKNGNQQKNSVFFVGKEKMFIVLFSFIVFNLFCFKISFANNKVAYMDFSVNAEIISGSTMKPLAKNNIIMPINENFEEKIKNHINTSQHFKIADFETITVAINNEEENSEAKVVEKTPEEIVMEKKREELKGVFKKEFDDWHSEKLKTYTFDGKKMVDPFMPIEAVTRKVDTEEPIIKKDDDKIEKAGLTALERLDLSQLTLRAIVLSEISSESVALVQDNNNMGHIVKVGTAIGRNSGYVKEILKDKIIIYEPVNDIITQSDFRLAELRLRSALISESGKTGTLTVH